MVRVAKQIVLAGPPGAGKSTIAALVGARLGTRSADLDDVIEQTTHRSPAEIIRQDGEARFREVEVATLHSLDDDFGVVALGGGTLTTRVGREAARARGQVVGLHVSERSLRERLAASNLDRPLLDEDALGALLERRRATYDAVDRRVDAEGDSESVRDRVLDECDATWVINARVGPQSSRVIVGHGLAAAVAGAVVSAAPRRPVVIVADAGVPEAKRIAVVQGIERHHTAIVQIVEGGEPVKQWSRLGDVLATALAAGAGRQSVVVGIGGGATCDLAGMVASLLGRGAPLVLVPSTVVAQADASVGGKCAVNMGEGRNLVGAFHAATDVIIDVDLLASLEPAEARSGLAEVLKMGIICDAGLFENLTAGGPLTAREIAAAVRHKADIVAVDPFEHDQRKWLNLGHTLGHALESASQFTLRHGDAVAIGIAAVARLGCERGWLDTGVGQRIIDGLRAVGLPVTANASLLEKCGEHFSKDKKSDGTRVDLVAIRDLGRVSIETLELNEVVPSLVRLGGAS